MASTYGIQASIAISGQTYRVFHYAIHEQLSEVSSLTCSLGKEAEDPPEATALVDQPAVLTLNNAVTGQKRTFVGTVVRARRSEEATEGAALIEVHVAPKAWRMSRRADCRTFQKMTVVDIVKQVLTDAGVDKATWNTTGTYPVRDYTVQYRETDLAFVLRLLSEEGIYFAIQHDDQADTMVFGDDPKGFGPTTGPASLQFKDTLAQTEDALQAVTTDVVETQQVRSDKTTLKDYDSTKPKLKLESTAKTDKADAEVYVWPGRFTDPKVGDRLAQVLLDSLRADSDVVTGRTPIISLTAGTRFSIDSHPYAPLNQEYLVVGVDLDGRDVSAGREQRTGEWGSCWFRAIPTKTLAYRPPRRVREHFVSGTQTAMSTGSAGEEIHTNENGQVVAQFHWDRLGKNDENSSLWMRTSQLPTGGSMLLPRMKWEVSVRYLEGDVDRPMVMARMYNTATPPPYKLPDNKGRSSIQTATTPGGGSVNEIRMSDDKGSEEMFMNASKDMSVDVGNNTTESIGVNLTRSIGSNHNLSITDSFSASVGASQSVSVSGNQDIHVQTFMVDQVTGNHTLAIGGARSMKVGGDHKREITGDSTLNANSMSIDLVVGTVNEHGLANYKHHVGAALVEMTAGTRSVTVTGNRSETATLAKIIYTPAGRSVDVTGTLGQKVGGLVYRKTDADLAESGVDFMEVAVGAQLFAAPDIAIVADSKLTIVMGASVIILTPASVSIAGVSVKIDGELIDEAALIAIN
ncbi:MAG: type VI secretion system tip protein TssI/VgrG [Polyangiaceae bacterium]|jgi:type VI secretion system secreted protein VgrG